MHERGIKSWHFIVLSVVIISLWAGSILLNRFLFSDWDTRGLFGDSFGSINALFSGLALAGVIYTLVLQRYELELQRKELETTRSVMEAQLDEMRTARRLQVQPLGIPSINQIRIDRPRFFYTPPYDQYSAQSRYHVDVILSNSAPFPAVSIHLRCLLAIPNGARTVALRATDRFSQVLAPKAGYADDPDIYDFMFATDDRGVLFDALRQRDPRLLPSIVVTVHFKNTTGAHFRVSDAFKVYATGQDVETLGKWHTAIVSFETKYKSEIQRLRRLSSNDRSGWQALFDSVKEEFDTSIEGDEALELNVDQMPGVFELNETHKEAYEEELDSAQYSQRVILGLYDCPVELDAAADSP